jgi:RNA polymerase sigma factor (sigma-70 family)
VDRDTLAAFREGRRDVLARVYRDHVREIALWFRRGFMYSSSGQPMRFAGVHSDVELEGFLQEVFMRAFAPRARLAYDGLRPYAGFLVGIARHVVLDHLRRTVRHGEVLSAPEVLDAIVDEGGQSALDTDDARRGSQLVQEFLARECDDRDRLLYGLRYDQELSQVDAASSARLSRIQVRRWERRFRERLLRFLKRADYLRDA